MRAGERASGACELFPIGMNASLYQRAGAAGPHRLGCVAGRSGFSDESEKPAEVGTREAGSGPRLLTPQLARSRGAHSRNGLRGTDWSHGRPGEAVHL